MALDSGYSYARIIALFFLVIQPIKQIWIFSCRQASTAVICWNNTICLLVLCGSDYIPILYLRNLILEQIDPGEMPYIRGFRTICSLYKKSFQVFHLQMPVLDQWAEDQNFHFHISEHLFPNFRHIELRYETENMIFEAVSCGNKDAALEAFGKIADTPPL